MLIVLALTLLACTSHKSEAKADPCVGRCDMVNGIACGNCGYGKTCNGQQYCVEIESPDFTETEETAVMPDQTDETPDIDDTYCPLLLKAPFPYYREDGTIHFCRPCDTPTEKDPQCLQNLWSEQNKKYTVDHPEADCYPYPCDMKNLKPMNKAETEAYLGDPALVSLHECDLVMIPNGWVFGGGNGGGWKTFSISNGKAGFVLNKGNIDASDYFTDYRAFEYDIASKAYRIVAPSLDESISYNTGHFFHITTDYRTLDLATNHHYIGYSGSDGSYRIVYNKSVDYFNYTPALNEKWAFGNISEGAGYRMMYAKIGEWQWQSLGVGSGSMPVILGDKLALTDEKFKAYICDLSKYPKSFSECFLVNREGELAAGMIFNKNDNNIFLYSSDFSRAITKVDMSKETPVYEDIITDFSEEMKSTPYSLVPRYYDGKLIQYNELSGSDGNRALACFYRMDKKQRYCMKPMEHDHVLSDGTVFYKYGFSEFDGKYLLYQKQGSTGLILRDMQCYCDKEGVCPFEN